MSIKIFIATHKNYEMPDDDIYIPLEVGASLRKDLGLKGVRDNTGLNISEKNPNYCELTGYFWIWKNIKDADVVALFTIEDISRETLKFKESLPISWTLKRLRIAYEIIKSSCP